jgi:hypothetical protein
MTIGYLTSACVWVIIIHAVKVAWLSRLERCVHIAEVTGSSPVATTIFLRSRGVVGLTCQPVTLEIAGSSPVGSAIKKATIAQSVEQRTENPRVAGSIPARGTIIIND